MKHKITFSLLGLLSASLMIAMETPGNPVQEEKAPSATLVSDKALIEMFDIGYSYADKRYGIDDYYSRMLLWGAEHSHSALFNHALYCLKKNKWWGDKAASSDIAGAFASAAARGNCAFLQTLLSESERVVNTIPGYNYAPASPGYNNASALAYAAANGHEDAVKLLLASKADPELTASRGKTPLEYSVANNHLGCTRTLLEAQNKANPNGLVSDKSFEYILHWTLSRPETIEHTKLLVACGADINLLNKKDRTPLMVAVEHGNLLGVQLLLSARANLEIKKPLNGFTVCQLAQLQADLEINERRKEIRKTIVQLIELAQKAPKNPSDSIAITQGL